MALVANPNPDPGREHSIGELIDIRLEIDEWTFEGLSDQLEEHKDRIGRLEKTVAVLEALLVGEAAA